MIIQHIRSERTPRGVKFSADVSWENSHLPLKTLYIESPALAQAPPPNAFFLMTMLELLVAGKLAQCPTFAHDDLSADLVASALRDITPSSLSFFRELVRPLEKMGRKDLAAVVSQKIVRVQAHAKIAQRPINKTIKKAKKTVVKTIKMTPARLKALGRQRHDHT